MQWTYAIILLFASTLLFQGPGRAERVLVSLDGTWQIEESLSANDVPSSFRHTVPVPGLAHLAVPPFPEVDLFDSPESIQKQIRLKILPASTPVPKLGAPRQNRNYLWYRRTFRVPEKKEVAILKINKAQFGIAVWLNGKKIGEHLGCFTASYFNFTDAIDWQGENTLVVRVGAHPAVLPATVPAGTDNEKTKWTPGIYDTVSLLLCDNPVVESVQVAPRIRSSEIVVQTRVKNYGAQRPFSLIHRVKTWGDGREVAGAGLQLSLRSDEEKTWTQTIRIPDAQLWSPESPFLYVAETDTGGDKVSTRFGMREFRFDTTTKRAYLNDKPYFLRGSNITLHRFFEDPTSGALPWNEEWVRKLLAEIPERLHWNSFRFCIGPAPEMWLDIADEAGLLIQNEFFVWGYRDEWKTSEMIRQYSDWMRDNWNHPSVVIWDANNETRADVLTDIIKAVRPLDLANRPWDNGYNLPAAGNDMIEDHPYLFSRFRRQDGFRMTELERMTGAKSTNSPHPSGHAVILNEYGWLWLNRDGTPTELTRNVYAKLLGRDVTPEDRFSLNAYLLAGLTEFWRAHRNFAGVLHFVYLTASFPGAYTSDHFLDLEELELEPHFEEYMSEAFKPLGVYINFWQPTIEARSDRRFLVMMINDDHDAVEGKLALTLTDAGGAELARREIDFALAALGQQTCTLDLHIPNVTGPCTLKAIAYPRGKRHSTRTVSRRRVSIVTGK
jgi:hypothetical protein